MHLSTTITAALLTVSTLLAPTTASDISITSPFKSRVARNLVPRTQWQDFKLSDIYFNTYDPGLYSIENRALSFYFTDPNNGGTSICTTRWHDPSTSNATLPSGAKHPDTKPTSYVNCGFNGRDEKFQFYIVKCETLGEVTLQLKHSYRDSVKYPPPYDTLGLFAEVEVKLECGKGEGGMVGCWMRPGNRYLRAPIDGATL